MIIKNIFIAILMLMGIVSLASAEEMPINRMAQVRKIKVGVTAVPNLPESMPVACTMEAKKCADGSYVGRVGPDCEFSLCPNEKPTSTPNIKIPLTPEVELKVENTPIVKKQLKQLEETEDNQKQISLLIKIKNAGSEEERVEIMKQEKKFQVNQVMQEDKIINEVPAKNLEKEEKTEKVISKKSDEIFTKFDIIISKLKKIILTIESKIVLLKEIGLDVTMIQENLTAISQKIETIEDQKATAWLLMQKTIELEDKVEAKNNLESVKTLLRTLKDDIKTTSENLKNVIKDFKIILNK